MLASGSLRFAVVVALALFSRTPQSVNALPLPVNALKQDINAPVAGWLTACAAAGGNKDCVDIGAQASVSLLSASDVCAQQAAADAMITLAKSLTKTPENLITIARVFRQTARDSDDKLSVLYCQNEPANDDLSGLFQCQFEGVSETMFTGNVAAGKNGTLPLGATSFPGKLGSCPSHPEGPLPAGKHLIDDSAANANSTTTTGSANSTTTATGTSSPVPLVTGGPGSTISTEVNASTTPSPSATDRAVGNVGGGGGAAAQSTSTVIVFTTVTPTASASATITNAPNNSASSGSVRSTSTVTVTTFVATTTITPAQAAAAAGVEAPLGGY